MVPGSMRIFTRGRARMMTDTASAPMNCPATILSMVLLSWMMMPAKMAAAR